MSEWLDTSEYLQSKRIDENTIEIRFKDSVDPKSLTEEQILEDGALSNRTFQEIEENNE